MAVLRLTTDLISVDHIILISALILICASISSVVYNRFYHPLAHIPGPFLGSVTELYKFFVLKSIPILGQDLHRKYGPVVRIAPNLLIFNDPELLPEVYNRKAQKTSWYESWMWGENVQAMFLTPKHDEHAAKKRIVGPACSLKSLKSFEDRFDARIDELCCVFDQRFISTNTPVDFAEWLRYFLCDTFTHLAYGKPTGCVRQGEDIDGNIQALQDTYYMGAVVAALPWFFLPIVRNRYVQQYVLPYTAYGRGMSQTFASFEEQHQQSHRELAKGFLNVIDERLSAPEVRAEYVTFTAATLDGVAAFVSPFIDNLIQHPGVLANIMNEIKAAEKQGLLSRPVAKFDEILALPYFQACIQESLRRDPPAQTLLPRIVGKEGFWYNNMLIPGGVEMAASPYIIHRNAKVFGEQPEVWRPERWLDGSTDVSKMLKYGMWWGYGERRCAGEHYAQLEMQKLCFELLRRFKITSTIPDKRFHHEKWAVGMYWHQFLTLERRDTVSCDPIPISDDSPICAMMQKSQSLDCVTLC